MTGAVCGKDAASDTGMSEKWCATSGDRKIFIVPFLRQKMQKSQPHRIICFEKEREREGERREKGKNVCVFRVHVLCATNYRGIARTTFMWKRAKQLDGDGNA